MSVIDKNKVYKKTFRGVVCVYRREIEDVIFQTTSLRRIQSVNDIKLFL